MGRWHRDHLGSDRGAHGSRAAVLHLAPDPSGGLRVTADSGVASLDAILTTVATAVADGSLKRLKLCASSDCRWASRDTSRSGGGRWCSMAVCGNRHKTRAYRRRQAD